MNNFLRPPAVPLVTIDPYFSVWSFADNLYDDFTRHWTGKRNAMTGIIVIDKTKLIFAGKVEQNSECYFPEPEQMKQTSVEVLPLTTRYIFNGNGVELTVEFTSPLLLEDLDILSRPVSYVTFFVRATDSKSHDVKVYFDISGEWCVNSSEQKVVWGYRNLEENIKTVYMGTESQKILERIGDDVRIDWGYLHLVTSDLSRTQTFIGNQEDRKKFIASGEIPQNDSEQYPAVIKDVQPILASLTCLGKVEAEKKSFLIGLAYDDIYSIEYFNEKLEAYWSKDGLTFDKMVIKALHGYESVMEKCRAFEKALLIEAENTGGKKYSDLISLAYRQSIAAHKLVRDKNGEILFLSKECFSNGCIATVDVSYPSIPLFIIYNPELVKGMLRPIFKYAAKNEWIFDFAPHDVGCYPKANGQVYGENMLENQMPVEECGNILVSCAAICIAEKNSSFAEENWELISKWGNYLDIYGFDPENQLCTDDFAGHLAHNCNLSIKAIVGIASYSILCKMLGKVEEGQRLFNNAKEMAIKWEALAINNDHYKLAFDLKETWSIKYNLIWDQIFNTNLFSKDIVQKELKYYLSKQNKYGVPLDSRSTYTKTDWLVWVAAMSDTKEAFEEMIRPLWDFSNETLNRVPFTDWYDTITGAQIGFQNRSVIGGIFIKILKDRGI